jgi:MFS family permease
MSYQSTRLHQLVDWRAAFLASMIAGICFFLLNLIFTTLVLGSNVWVFIRLLASPVMNKAILAPPAAFDAAALIVALLTHLGLSLIFGLLIAYIIHRGGLITGIIGGAVLGLALYAINFYTLTIFFPWFFAMASWGMVVTHLVFGALVGGIYEALEVDIYVQERSNYNVG